jgi:hypothetical protein
MQTAWLDNEKAYDGSQLCSLFAYLKHGIHGNSFVSWRAPCNIPSTHIVDGEDLLANKSICGSDMLHFIAEIFHSTLHYGVALQRLMTSIAKDLLHSLSNEEELLSQLHRKGDDLYCGHKKFNISIATSSPHSVLIHFAVNVSNIGTPVPTVSLEDFKISPNDFSEKLRHAFISEFESMDFASKKVRWVL